MRVPQSCSKPRELKQSLSSTRDEIPGLPVFFCMQPLMETKSNEPRYWSLHTKPPLLSYLAVDVTFMSPQRGAVVEYSPVPPRHSLGLRATSLVFYDKTLSDHCKEAFRPAPRTKTPRCHNFTTTVTITNAPAAQRLL